MRSRINRWSLKYLDVMECRRLGVVRDGEVRRPEWNRSIEEDILGFNRPRSGKQLNLRDEDGTTSGVFMFLGKLRMEDVYRSVLSGGVSDLKSPLTGLDRLIVDSPRTKPSSRT